MIIKTLRVLCELMPGRNATNSAKPETHPGQIALEGRVGHEIIVNGVKDGKCRTLRDVLYTQPNNQFFYLSNGTGHYIVHWNKPRELFNWGGEYTANALFKVYSIELPDGTLIYTDDSVPFEARD